MEHLDFPRSRLEESLRLCLLCLDTQKVANQFHYQKEYLLVRFCQKLRFERQ
jgi:hypothetical protein